MSADVHLATVRFLDFQSAQTIGRRLSHGVGYSSPDVNSRRSSALTPRRESSPEPIQECEPTSVLMSRETFSTSLESKHDTSPRAPSSRNFPAIPSRDIGSAAKKFSYTDVNSSFFRNKISKLHNTESSISMKMDPLTSSYVNPNSESALNENYTLNRENWANVSDKSVEHIIEIIIPDDKLRTNKQNIKSVQVNSVPKYLKEKFTTKHQGELCAPVKPKIVSYIPRKSDSDYPSYSKNDSELGHVKSESPLQKLSREELLSLIKTPEDELKNSILECLKYKDEKCKQYEYTY